MLGQLTSVGGFLSNSALAFARKGGSVATSVASSTSSVVTQAASSVVDTAKATKDLAASSLQSAGEHVAALATTALTQTYYTGEALVGEGIRVSANLSSSAVQSARASTEWIYDTSVTLRDHSVDLVAGKFLGLLENTGSLLSNYVAAPIGGTVVSTFDTLAGDPTTPASVHMNAARIVAGFLPITGGAKDIGTARELYRQAQTLPDGAEKESRVHQARRDCLIATTSLSLDVISYFATGGAALAVKTGSTAFSALNVAKGAKDNETVGRFLPKINIDLLSPQADLALSSPIIREAMEIILRYDPKKQGDEGTILQ